MDFIPTPIGDMLTEDFVREWAQFTDVEEPSCLTFLLEASLRTRELTELLRSGKLNSDAFLLVARELSHAQNLRSLFEKRQFELV